MASVLTPQQTESLRKQEHLVGQVMSLIDKHDPANPTRWLAEDILKVVTGTNVKELFRTPAEETEVAIGMMKDALETIRNDAIDALEELKESGIDPD